MNLEEHLGDAYDFIKPFLMNALAPGEEWRIHPMLTGTVNPDLLKDFEKLMGATVVCDGSVPPHKSGRQSCLEKGIVDSHVFWDPTTGVLMPGKNPSGPKKNFILIDELDEFVAGRSGYLTLVYDQSVKRPKGVKAINAARQSAEMKLRELCERKVHGIAYVSQAPFLILADNSDLIDGARANLLGAHLPAGRIIGPS